MPAVYLIKEQLEALDYRMLGEMQPCIVITHANPDTNVAGTAHAAKRAIVKAHPANTGIAWVEFGSAAVEAECYPLNANESFSGPLTNTNQINCLFKVGGEKVTVAFSR